MVQPEQVLKELDEMWVSVGRQSETEGGVVRACALTLIVVTDCSEDTPTIGETVAELMREHPCRAIVLCLRPSADQIDAKVTAQCWMPFGTREQICCELIEVTAGESSVPSLPGFILPLTAPDLPVVMWLRRPRLDLSHLADTIIVDSAQLGGLRGFLEFRRRAAAPRVADLAWTRLTPWREIIAQIFENPVARDRRSRISQAEILWSGEPVRAEVYYLAAWLMRGLELQRDGLVLTHVPVGTAGIQGIALAAPDLAISAKLTERSVVEVRVNTVARQTVFSPLTDCVLLREELSITSRDAVFEESVTLAEQLERGGG